MASRAA